MARLALLFLAGSAVAHAGAVAVPEADPDPDDSNLPIAPMPSEEATKPAPYWIHGRLDGTTAKIRLRYHLHPVGPSSWNAFELEMPGGGVVTGATISGAGVTKKLALETEDAAAKKFSTVGDATPGQHRGWAVMVTAGDEFRPHTTKVLVAAPHTTTLTLDLEIDAPTCFHADQRLVPILNTWKPSVDRAVKTVTEGCKPVPADDWDGENTSPLFLAWPAPTRERDIQIATRSERLDVAHGSFAHLEVALGTKLATVPADLHTVFVVDASRSVTTSELETEAALIKSYLAQAPGTKVQVVLYARKPRALLADWTTAGAASAEISTALAHLVEQNGSNVDAGLVEAARWLSRIEGTRRVVLFSDQRLAQRVEALRPEVLRAVLPVHTLVHVVGVDTQRSGGAWHGTQPSNPFVGRDDDVAFAQLAIQTEGFAAHGHTVEGKTDALVLVRPIQLEQVSIAGGAWADGGPPYNARGCPQERADRDFAKLDLDEGDSCEWAGTGNGEAAEVTLHGLLWNHKVERKLAPDRGGQLQLARALVGSGLHDEPAKDDIALASRAVSSAWSLFTTWGGADGYRDRAPLDSGVGYGCGCGGRSDMGTFGSSIGKMTMTRPSLEEQLGQAVAACRADGQTKVDVELTQNEIVDVKVTAANAALRDCVTEAVWGAEVYLTKPLEHSTAHVTL